MGTRPHAGGRRRGRRTGDHRRRRPGRYLDPRKDAEKYARCRRWAGERACTAAATWYAWRTTACTSRAVRTIRRKVGGRRIELGRSTRRWCIPASAAARPPCAKPQAAHRFWWVTSPQPTRTSTWLSCPRAPLRFAAGRAGAATGAGRRTAHPHLREGRPQRTAVAAARRCARCRVAAGRDHMGWLATAWQDVLGTVVDGREADFFALGGGLAVGGPTGPASALP